jgi:RNA polymerase sigma-70 factor (ECF subfamily)
LSEQQLIERLTQKDKSALEYLYDHYSGALYGVILRIVNSESIAEEVLQDAFVKIWDKIASYDAQKGALFTWMMTISRNLALDKLRSKGYKKEKKTDDIENNVHITDHRHSTEINTEHIGVKDMLNELHEEQRFVVEMLYFRGYTQSELAKEYGIPLGTVKTRLRSAIIKLRHFIEIK